MALKAFSPVLLVALALFAFASPSTAARPSHLAKPSITPARHLLTSSCDDNCKMKEALLSVWVRANLLSCAAYGTPITGSDYCGPNDGPVHGCKLAPLSADAKVKIDGLLVNAKAQIKLLRAVLGGNVQPLAAIDIEAFVGKVLSAALNVDVGTFNCYNGDDEVFLAAFILADLDVNILVSLKYLLNVNAYLQVVLQLLPTCQSDLANLQAWLSLIADVVICVGLQVQVVVNACIKYLDCGLCGVLGIPLQLIVGSVLGLINILLGINLSALLDVFVKLCGILQLCIYVA